MSTPVRIPIAGHGTLILRDGPQYTKDTIVKMVEILGGVAEDALIEDIDAEIESQTGEQNALQLFWEWLEKKGVAMDELEKWGKRAAYAYVFFDWLLSKL